MAKHKVGLIHYSSLFVTSVGIKVVQIVCFGINEILFIDGFRPSVLSSIPMHSPTHFVVLLML